MSESSKRKCGRGKKANTTSPSPRGPTPAFATSDSPLTEHSPSPSPLPTFEPVTKKARHESPEVLDLTVTSNPPPASAVPTEPTTQSQPAPQSSNGNDPIAVMNALPLLPRGEVVSVGSKGEGTFDIDVATFERAYRADPDILTRLNRLTVHPGSPELLNLAMADVKSLKTLSKGNTFLSKETFASEKLSHQVGIAVSDLTWHRLLAVIAATFKINAPLNIPSYKRGVVFSTRMKNERIPSVAGVAHSPNKGGGFRSAKTAWEPVLPWNAHVPIYDGRTTTFTLSTFRQALPEMSDDITIGSAVLVTFTLHVYKRTVKETTYSTVSFNLQQVIVLADPVYDAYDRDDVGEESARDIAPGVYNPSPESPAADENVDELVF